MILWLGWVSTFLSEKGGAKVLDTGKIMAHYGNVVRFLVTYCLVFVLFFREKNQKNLMRGYLEVFYSDVVRKSKLIEMIGRLCGHLIGTAKSNLLKCLH